MLQKAWFKFPLSTHLITQEYNGKGQQVESSHHGNSIRQITGATASGFKQFFTGKREENRELQGVKVKQ